jgi:hypothetical protein
LYWKGLPLYRQLVDSPTTFETREPIWGWALAAIVLIQVGYWMQYILQPALPHLASVVLGHIVLFLARLSFLLATSVFSFVFIAKKLESQLMAFELATIIVALFSLFCYMQELQRLGTALLPERQPLPSPKL